jgi:ribonuclease HI
MNPAQGRVGAGTDGACRGNPGPGGWAWTTGSTDASGCQRVTTNQEMELRAILEALRAHPDQPVAILTDSQYVIDCVTSWLPGWRRNGWRTSARRPVKHQPTIAAIATELDRRPVQLVKVPAAPASSSIRTTRPSPTPASAAYCSARPRASRHAA